MKKTRAFGFGVITLVGLLLASCQGQNFASKTVLSLTTKNAQPAVAGRDYTALYTIVSPGNGKSTASVGPLAIRKDGSAIISRNPPGVHGNLIAQGQLGIQTGTTRTWFPLQAGSKPRQIFEAVSSGKSVFWGESPNKNLDLDWRLFSVTAGQRDSKLIADSYDLLKTTEIPWPPGMQMLSTDGSNVWWTMVYPSLKSPSGWGSLIMVRDIGARKPLKIAVDLAMMPKAIAAGLIYVRSKDVDPTMTSSRYDIRLLKNGVDTLITSGLLAKGQHISSLCTSDTLLAWGIGAVSTSSTNFTGEPYGHLHLMTLATKVQRVVSLSNSAVGLSLGCGTDFVAWGNGSGSGDDGQYVLNVPSGKIWKLGSLQGLSAVQVAGNILAWALPTTSGKTAPWRVVKWHAV
jgi:hypothetical protein